VRKRPPVNAFGVCVLWWLGVGFYSVYLVADSVAVHSKSNEDDKQWVWESTADSTFSVREATEEDESLGRGSKIVLSLKEDCLEFLEEERLKGLIKRYSEFINFPIYLYTSKEEEEEVPIEEGDSESEEEEEEEEVLAAAPACRAHANHFACRPPVHIKSPERGRHRERVRERVRQCCGVVAPFRPRTLALGLDDVSAPLGDRRARTRTRRCRMPRRRTRRTRRPRPRRSRRPSTTGSSSTTRRPCGRGA
jgi:hypothetical protein